MTKTHPSTLPKTQPRERHVYVTYIATTPDRVWQALITGDLTRQYWAGNENISDWKEGSSWEHRTADAARTLRVLGKVIEVRPPNRLVLTWVEPAFADDPAQYSQVTFEIESIENTVRLTVTHEDLIAGSPIAGRIVHGWPRVLSSLKTLLETGTALSLWGCSSGNVPK